MSVNATILIQKRMKYKGYVARDFANDSFFIRWVKNPNTESDWFWTNFIKENPACQVEIEEARRLICLFDFRVEAPSGDDLQAMRNRLLMALQADKEMDHSFARPYQNANPVKRWLQVAALVLIIPLGSLGVFLVTRDSPEQLAGGEPIENHVEKRVNPSGQKSVLFLRDGTKVWLNAASRISYAKNFTGHDTRDVYLEGEAFFDVAHDEDRPFIVHTSSIRIKVLGTSFNVKSYSEEKTIETTLIRGKVRIEQSDATGSRIGDVELKPNQQAVFIKESKILNITEVVADNSGSWRRERLVFDEALISDVILQMERWFNIKIHFEDKASMDCRLTASIENESLEDVLKLMAASHNISYRISGTNVFIKGNMCGDSNQEL